MNDRMQQVLEEVRHVEEQVRKMQEEARLKVEREKQAEEEREKQRHDIVNIAKGKKNKHEYSPHKLPRSHWSHPHFCENGRTTYHHWRDKMRYVFFEKPPTKHEIQQRKTLAHLEKYRGPERAEVHHPAPGPDHKHLTNYGAHPDAHDVWHRHKPIPPQEGDLKHLKKANARLQE